MFFMYNFFYLQEFQISAQLMTDTIYTKRGPTRLYYGFRVKRLVSMALTKFRKIFMYLLSSAFICFFAQSLSPINYCPPFKDPIFFQNVKMNPDTSFSCYLVSVMTLNVFVLRKHRLTFEHCHYFILFLSISGAVSVKTGRNQFPVSYRLMSVPLICSINSLFVLMTRFFNVLS